MGEIHELPKENIPRFIPGIKIISALLLTIAAISVAFVHRPTTPPRDELAMQVLGEHTQTVESLLPNKVKAVAVGFINAPNASVDANLIMQTGRDLAASASYKIAHQAEHVASSAAHRFSDFIYKNTIERVINNLIHILPTDRQSKYEGSDPESSIPTPSSPAADESLLQGISDNK
jgi:hypothetical protein